MAFQRQQMAFTEETLDNPDLLAALESWAEAKEEWEDAGKPLRQALTDAKKKIEALTPTDGHPHDYRLGRFVVRVRLTEASDVEFTREAKERVTPKLL